MPKKFLLSQSIILISLAFLVFFPFQTFFQQMILWLAFLFIFPVLCLVFILKEPPFISKALRTDRKKNILWLVGTLISAFILQFLVFFLSPLQMTEVFSSLAGMTFTSFLFSIFVILYITFGLEYFFREFALRFWQERWGIYTALALQWILSSGLVFFFDNSTTALPFSISAFFAGVLILKTRSFVFSWTFSALFVIISLLILPR